jgi:hypothetical protein
VPSLLRVVLALLVSFGVLSIVCYGLGLLTILLID